MTDLERAFDQLRGHTTTITLPPPQALRQRGDRRRRARAAVGLLSVAVVVMVASGGAVVLLGAPRPVQPGPQVTSGPAPTTTTTPPAPPTPVEREEAPAPAPGQPATFPPGCFSDPDAVGIDVNTGGTALPAALALPAADWGPCYTLLADERGYDLDNVGQPDVCLDDRAYDTAVDRVAGRSRIYTMGPEIEASESVVQYAPGRAAAYLAEVRDRVAQCATQERPDGNLYALILSQGFAGDESLMVYRGENPTGGYPGRIWTLIRIGDVVATLQHGGDQGVDPDRDLEMAGKAVAYLR